MSKKKFYVVWQGKKPGIYTNWNECKKQITQFKGAKYKSFPSEEKAKLAFSMKYDEFTKQSKETVLLSETEKKIYGEPDYNTISVDAACSENPGLMEYQGVDTKTKQQIFYKKFDLGTNNIGEFLALVHGLALLKEKKSKLALYTDSENAISWVKRKRCVTLLKENEETKYLFQVIRRAEKWLKENTFDTKILKWNTKVWGEIPADFGRK